MSRACWDLQTPRNGGQLFFAHQEGLVNQRSTAAAHLLTCVAEICGETDAVRCHNAVS